MTDTSNPLVTNNIKVSTWEDDADVTYKYRYAAGIYGSTKGGAAFIKADADANSKSPGWGVVADLDALSAQNGKLAEAKFSIYTSQANALAGTNPVKFKADTSPNTYEYDTGGTITEITTGSTGAFQLIGFPNASVRYWIKETSPPPNYQPITTPYEFSITANGSAPNCYALYDESAASTAVVLTKTEKDAPSVLLAGAKFEIWTAANGKVVGFTKTADGKFAYDTAATNTTLVTGADGTLEVTGLAAGEYYFLETQAPIGYVTPTGNAAKVPFTVKVVSAPTTVNVTMQNTPTTREDSLALPLKAKKTTTGAAMTAGQFSFELWRSNASGAQLQKLQTKQNTSAGNESDVTFDALLFDAAGTYYFLVNEVTTTQLGWALSTAQYLVKVVVVDDGADLKFSSVTYGSRAGATGSFGDESTWLPYHADGSSNGTAATIAFNPTFTPAFTGGPDHVLPYQYDPSFVMVRKKNFSAAPAWRQLYRDFNNVFRLETQSEPYVEIPALCAVETADTPVIDDAHTWLSDRNGTESALAYALATLEFGGLDMNDLVRFLALPSAPASDLERSYLIQFVLWMYEFHYQYNFAPSMLPPANLGTGTDEPWGTTYGIPGTHLSQLIRGTKPNGKGLTRNFSPEFIQAVKMINEMMVQYKTGKTTSLDMTYTASTPTTGLLTFDHDGFVPHNASGEQYDARLSWTAASGLSVKVNSTNYTTSPAGGVPVKKTDTIEVTHTGAFNTVFTLEDNGKYLKAQSILGDLTKNTTNVTHQNCIIGHAEFVTLKNTLNLSGFEENIEFVNTYTAQETSLVLKAKKTTTGADMTAGQFSFELWRSDASGAQLEKLQTKQNASAGNESDVTFDALLFDAVGTYYFLVNEVGTPQPGWVLSTAQYLFKAVVTSVGDQLQVTVTYGSRAGNSGTFGSEKSQTGGPLTPGHRYTVALDTDAHSIWLIDMDHAKGVYDHEIKTADDTLVYTSGTAYPAGSWLTYLAGKHGVSGSADGLAQNASFNAPQGVVVAENGDIYIADTENSSIRRIYWNTAATPPDWYVETVATGLHKPMGLAIYDGWLYTAQSEATGGNRIVKVNMQSHQVLSVAGNGSVPANQYTNCGDGTYTATSITASPLFKGPMDVALDAQGNIYVADTDQHRIRKISADLTQVRTIYGDGGATVASYPRGIEVGPDGAVYVSLSGANKAAAAPGNVIVKLTPADNTFGAAYTAQDYIGVRDNGGFVIPRANPLQYVSVPDDHQNGTSGAKLFHPRGLSIDPITGDLYFSDEGNGAIRMKLGLDDTVKTLVGTGNEAGSAKPPDGVYSNGFQFYEPMDVFFFRVSSDGGEVTFTNRFDGDTLDFSFIKTDNTDQPFGENEAAFALYACQTPTTPSHTHDELVSDESGNCWYTDPPYQTAVTDADGRVSFTGLATGEYMLVETKTLAGYQLPTGQWLLNVDVDADTITITAKGSDLPPAFKVTIAGDGSALYSLPNYPKLILPKSGAVTSLLFTVFGVLLVGAAVFLGLFKRRRRNKDSGADGLLSRIYKLPKGKHKPKGETFQ
ncbi:MAG: LPXTG cell wall anchor domain-containing protein [Oscillospiraceae bacterium]|nr:LPXTG cell wall anchor domain-containing protein [Oscillospiraceae bacterium]